jgi:hypothetical protein
MVPAARASQHSAPTIQLITYFITKARVGAPPTHCAILSSHSAGVPAGSDACWCSAGQSPSTDGRGLELSSLLRHMVPHSTGGILPPLGGLETPTGTTPNQETCGAHCYDVHPRIHTRTSKRSWRSTPWATPRSSWSRRGTCWWVGHIRASNTRWLGPRHPQVSPHALIMLITL